MRSSLIIIQVGTPPEDIRLQFGDLPNLFCQVLGRELDAVDVIPVFQGAALPKPDPRRVAIITGSWAMVTQRLDWSEATAQWIRDAMAVDMPLFGVCYGHQLMAHALGGVVDYHPQGREVGMQQVHLLANARHDPLLGNLPPIFPALLTHLQTVLRLPPGATALARSDHDPHQIIRYGAHAMSTQFHPEFTTELSAACISRQRDVLIAEGRDPDALLQNLQETPVAAKLLRDFVAASMVT